MRKDRDYYDTGNMLAGVLGISIIFMFIMILSKFIFICIGGLIRKIGLLSTVCVGFSIYYVILLFDRVLTPILQQPSESLTGNAKLFWQYFVLQRGSATLEYTCLAVIFALFWGIVHRVLHVIH